MRHVFVCLMCLVLSAGTVLGQAQVNNTIITVLNNGTTTLYPGDAIQPDTTSHALLVGSAALGLSLPDTATVANDSVAGFVLTGVIIGNTVVLDTLSVTGIKITNAGNSVTSGVTTVSDSFAYNLGGDSTNYFGTWSSITQIEAWTSGGDSVIFRTIPLYGVVKADSNDLSQVIGVVLPNRITLQDTNNYAGIVKYERGRAVANTISGKVTAPVNGNTTKVLPWDGLLPGTSGWVKATGNDSTAVLGLATKFTNTTGDTTAILLINPVTQGNRFDK
jgi:hypothetical protein